MCNFASINEPKIKHVICLFLGQENNFLHLNEAILIAELLCHFPPSAQSLDS